MVARKYEVSDIAAAVAKYGTQEKAARALGLSLRRVAFHLAKHRQQVGDVPTPAGFSAHGASTLYDAEGNQRIVMSLLLVAS